ncbi:hypothetical protein C2S52_009972 [Perilla frutescens var. hirtella]|nr:hypothetical protein C2S52_009972 [Perilla frutescens var. hirtella]
MWTMHPEFPDIIETTWDDFMDRTRQFVICTKLRHLKKPLKTLNAHHFNHISSRAKEAEIELIAAQEALQEDPQNQSISASIGQLKGRAFFLAETERQFYAQKSKLRHLNLSDKDTRYFHSMVKSNQKRNFIAAVTCQDESVTNSETQVASEFVSYYRILFRTFMESEAIDPGILSRGRMISDSDKAFLCGPVLDSEIKEATFGIGDDKTPGPDGFSSAFFKKTWNIVGSLVCDAVNEFFQNGKILRQLNHTTIAGDIPSVRIFMGALEDFHKQSGLMVNSEKSSLFSSGIFGDDMEAIKSLVGCPVGTFPVRYLGIPLNSQKLNVVQYAPLLDRITAYISSWTTHSLSYAGRMELIKAIAQGVEYFWHQIFPLPASVIN